MKENISVKTHPECIICILEDIIDAGSLILNEQQLEALTVEAVKSLGDYETEKLPSFYITKAHRILKRISGIEAPFLEKRARCNKIGMQISDKIRSSVTREREFDTFSQCLTWVIFSNSLDFRSAGKGYGFSLSAIEDELRHNIADGLAVNDTDKIWQKLDNTKKVLYILDNVGEIAFDKLFIESFLQDKEIIACVRDGVLTSDVTEEDVAMVGLNNIADIISSGGDTLGILYEELSSDLRKAFVWADLVIAKGQANFYFFSKYWNLTQAPVVCLFTTKCDLISRIFGKTGKKGIAKYFSSS